MNRAPDPSDFLAGGDDDGDADGKESNKADDDDDDDELDYEGSTQELLANVDCLLTTDGGNGSQVRRWRDDVDCSELRLSTLTCFGYSGYSFTLHTRVFHRDLANDCFIVRVR